MLTDGKKITLDEEIYGVCGPLAFQSVRALYRQFCGYQIDQQVYRNQLLAAFHRQKQIPAHPKESLFVHVLEESRLEDLETEEDLFKNVKLALRLIKLRICEQGHLDVRNRLEKNVVRR